MSWPCELVPCPCPCHLICRWLAGALQPCHLEAWVPLWEHSLLSTSLTYSCRECAGALLLGHATSARRENAQLLAHAGQAVGQQAPHACERHGSPPSMSMSIVYLSPLSRSGAAHQVGSSLSLRARLVNKRCHPLTATQVNRSAEAGRRQATQSTSSQVLLHRQQCCRERVRLSNVSRPAAQPRDCPASTQLQQPKG